MRQTKLFTDLNNYGQFSFGDCFLYTNEMNLIPYCIVFFPWHPGYEVNTDHCFLSKL